MRCIEICYRACKYAFDRININMRCIEIPVIAIESDGVQ